MHLLRLVVLSLVLSLLPSVVAANALTDLRTTLGRMPATTHVHGMVDISSTSHSSDDETGEDGKISVGFDAGPGLNIIYSPALLRQAAIEARNEARDPEKKAPIRRAAQNIRPLHLAELLDAASALDVLLETAQLIEVKPSTFAGKPARTLSLKLNSKLSKSDSKRVKKLESSMSVWVGDDGIPLAAEQTSYLKASFLVVSLEVNKKEHWAFLRAGDRLTVSRYEKNDKSDGLGQHSNSHTVETIRLEN